MKKILFTGGGSAGHVVPNLALIEPLKNRYEIAYIGTDKIESELVPPTGIPFYRIECPKLIRRLTLKNLTIPLSLQKAKRECKRILQDIAPDLVFSKGGYVALPVVLAAKQLKIPCLTHESDLTAGLTNRLIARKCKNVLCSFSETTEAFPNGKYTGSPIREELFSASKKDAMQKYAFSGKRKILLVLGGGSGSVKINEALRRDLSLLAKRYDILHVCGKGNTVQNNIAGYVQREYEPDMASAYACADLVIARSGSNTLFEVLALHKKALFIPLESGSRGDQLKNAEYFEKKRLCHVLREKQLEHLFPAIENAISDKELCDNLTLSGVKSGTENIIKEIERAL